ncbi:SDR family NAD(P)-dependent oxidoreductase [Oceanicola sp. S124]|uniref:SDR family NAD(P)-dependent oxidoreductase n=1 Tax=Oceanicola sp. S124 TaxID=1042378 RepID=UPI00025585FD|nr:SDR family NAD(P)-dependent oxidoreductase [Oceanicola sp. S124]
MKLQDVHVAVTGGGSGLGAATARALHAAGAKITIIDRNAAAAEAVAAELSGVAKVIDVADPVAAETALDEAIAALGPLRGLVNCAGIGEAGRVVGREGPLPFEDFERTIRVNLLGSFNMLRLAAARMTLQDPLEDGERGVIVNTASVAAFDGQIGQAAYSASKGGIVAMALPIARELARFGIRVNTIAPGLFLTPLLEGLGEEVQKSIAATIPFPQRLGDPAEYGATVKYIFETAYLNAEVIRLDGAVRMQPK